MAESQCWVRGVGHAAQVSRSLPPPAGRFATAAGAAGRRSWQLAGAAAAGAWTAGGAAGHSNRRRCSSVLVCEHRLQLAALRLAELLARELQVEAQAQVALDARLAVGHACGGGLGRGGLESAGTADEARCALGARLAFGRACGASRRVPRRIGWGAQRRAGCRRMASAACASGTAGRGTNPHLKTCTFQHSNATHLGH